MVVRIGRGFFAGNGRGRYIRVQGPMCCRHRGVCAGEARLRAAWRSHGPVCPRVPGAVRKCLSGAGRDLKPGFVDSAIPDVSPLEGLRRGRGSGADGQTSGWVGLGQASASDSCRFAPAVSARFSCGRLDNFQLEAPKMVGSLFGPRLLG